jgi:hypothetical protein
MNKEQLFQNIETILNYLKEYNRIQVIDFSKNPSDKDLFKAVLKQVYPSVQPDLTCASCVVHLMNNLQAYYEREYSKWKKEQFHFVGIAEPQVEPKQKVPRRNKKK